MGHPAPSDPRRGAVASLLLGLSSVLCLGPITGLPAIALGAMARRDMDRSPGARASRAGAGAAAGGIVLGLFGTGLGLVGMLVVASGIVQLAEAPGDVAGEVASAPGSLAVVDLASSLPLQAQLDSVIADAKAEGRIVVLLTHVPRSVRGAQLDADLAAFRTNRALAGVTLVRANVEAFDAELRAMRVETAGPWFYVLDSAARPTAALSAEELDTSVPDATAAVLGSFARGRRGR